MKKYNFILAALLLVFTNAAIADDVVDLQALDPAIAVDEDPATTSQAIADTRNDSQILPNSSTKACCGLGTFSAGGSWADPQIHPDGTQGTAATGAKVTTGKAKN